MSGLEPHPHEVRQLKRVAKSNRACDNCGTTRTPNWRKGWPLANGLFANLCNACGIRCVANPRGRAG